MRISIISSKSVMTLTLVYKQVEKIFDSQSPGAHFLGYLICSYGHNDYFSMVLCLGPPIFLFVSLMSAYIVSSVYIM